MFERLHCKKIRNEFVLFSNVRTRKGPLFLQFACNDTLESPLPRIPFSYSIRATDYKFCNLVYRSTVFKRQRSTSLSTKMASHNLVILLTLTLALHTARSLPNPPPCTTGKFPLELPAIRREATAPGGCSRGGSQSTSVLKVFRWGLLVSPDFYYAAGCREDIVTSYTRSNAPAMIYHRPPVGPEYFKNSYPGLYAKHLKREFVTWPCNKVPVRNVHVWNNRKLFVSLLTKATRIAEYIRATDCAAPENRGNPFDTFSWAYLRSRIAEDRVVTASINFLHNVAFSNFFCV